MREILSLLLETQAIINTLMKTIDITKNLIIIIIITKEKPRTENNKKNKKIDKEKRKQKKNKIDKTKKNHDLNPPRILSIRLEEKLFLKHHDFTI
jgi:hypothetical protein